jgi:hypothetical protein
MLKHLEKFKNKKTKILNSEVHVAVPIIAFIVITLAVGYLITRIAAGDPLAWNQTDWSGGTSSGVITTDVTTFSSSSNIKFSDAGEIKLSSLDDAWDTDFLSWQYRRKLTFDNTTANIGQTSEALTDFPVLVKLTGGVNIDYSKTKDAGEDIRFSDPNGTNLSYEIDTWNELGDSFVWVKVPQIDIDSNTDKMYMYYGNAAASDGQNVTGTWNSGYLAVWHMNESSGAPQDSTSNNFDLDTTVGTPLYAQTGKIGRGISTNGGTAYFTKAVTTGLPSGNTSYTQELWWSITNNLLSIGLMGWGDNSANTQSYFNHQLGAYTVTWAGFTLTGNHTSLNNTFYRGAATWDGTNRRVLSDGLTLNSDTPAAHAASAGFFRVGSSTYAAGFSGIIDEVRISTVGRSRAWLAADYHAQTEDFITYDAELNPTTPGTLTSNIFDTNVPVTWDTVSFTQTLNSGTTQVRVRTGNVSDMSDAVVFATCDPITSGADISANNCVDDNDSFVQYQVTIIPASPFTSPVFTGITVNYASTDDDPPDVNATSVALSGITNGVWTNTEPTITWNAGSDAAGGLGLLGYCVSLEEANVGASTTLDPATDAGILTGKNDGVTRDYCDYIVTSTSLNLASVAGLTLTTGKQYYFSIKAVDLGSNTYTGASNTFQDLVSFKYDIVEPTPPAYIALPGNFVSDKEVTFTWATAGDDAPVDDDSDLAGLQYRIGDSGTWYGDLHLGSEDINDLLVNDGSYTMDETTDFPNLIEGSNPLYVRALDNAGNISSVYATGFVKINTVAPSSPRNLEVTPTTSTTNSYAFDWDAPSTFQGAAVNITYCYTINTLPTVDNCNFTAAGESELDADAFATEPGTNTFYVVAKDEANNINYDTYVFVEFNYDGTAPGIPTNVDIADISVRATSNWKLALSWGPPASLGSGIASYKIYRTTTANSCSSNFDAFSQVGSTAGTSFVDTGLSQTSYSYCVKACDSASNCSAASTTVSRVPTGKFTEPADLTSGPTASLISTTKAVITWHTQRESDSHIQYGVTSGNYFDEESISSEQTTAHTVTVSNLDANTTYFYRARWIDLDGNIGISDEKVFRTDPPPVIQNVSESSVGISSALVSFTSTNAARVRVYYGLSRSYGGVEELPVSLVEGRYSVQLANLQDGSEYFYKVNALDIESKEYEGEVHTFTTLPRPKISNVKIVEVKETAQPTILVTWDSNTEVSSIISYYPAANPTDVRNSINIDLVKGKHSQEVSGLLAETEYNIIVKGIDRFGNEAQSDIFEIRTATDSRPPTVSNIRIEGGILTSEDVSEEKSAQLIVAWDTDEPSTSQVELGEGSGVTYTQISSEDSNLTSNHLIIMSNLSPSKVYHLRVISTDSADNTVRSADQVTITPKNTESVVEVLFGALGDIFDFLR